MTVLSHDGETNPDVVAMVAASSALTLSGIPFMGPIGGCRVGYDGKNYTLNPKINESTELDLVIAGTGEAVLMVESEANQLSEDIMLGAVKFGHESIQEVIKTIINLAEECANDPWEFEYSINDTLFKEIKDSCGSDIKNSYSIVDKMERHQSINKIKEGLEEKYKDNEDYNLIAVSYTHLTLPTILLV